MNLTIPIILTDDQIKGIEDRLFERLKESKLGEKRTEPYTVKEFAALTPWTERTVRNKIEAGLIRLVDLPGQMLIPASEYERLFG